MKDGSSMQSMNRRSVLASLLGVSAVGVGTAHGLSFRDKGISHLLNSAQAATRNASGVSKGTRRIGVEEHYTTEALVTYLISRLDAGATFKSPLQPKVSAHADALLGDKRLKDMDEAGISMQILSPVCFYDGLDAVEGPAMARKANDETARAIKENPGRYAGFAGLACKAPDAAAKELERAVMELGLKGAIIYGHVDGEYLDAQKYRVIFATAEKLGVPIFLHPREPSPSMIKPYETYSTLEGPMLGFGADTALHAMRLICSGLFDECPNLKMILGHGGEGLPFWLWRMDKGGSGGAKGGALAAAKGSAPDAGGGAPGAGVGSPFGTNPVRCKKSPSYYIKEHFYMNTSGMPWPPVLEFIHNAMGANKILIAVDYPAESNTLAVQAVNSMQISSSDKQKIFHENAEKLLNL